jgi:hypothetical protein
VPALDLFRCRRTSQGFEAVAKWRPSTEGRKNEDRRRNLKIASNGIKDFGVDQGYTAIDLVMAALGCDLETAFVFLDGRLGWSGGEPLLDTSLNSSGPAASVKLEMLGLEPDESPNGTGLGLKRLIDLILRKRLRRLVITRKDQLSWFGSELVFTLCELQNVEVVITNGGAPPILVEEGSARDEIEIRRLCERLIKGADAGVPQAGGVFHSSGEPPAGGNGQDPGTE